MDTETVDNHFIKRFPQTIHDQYEYLQYTRHNTKSCKASAICKSYDLTTVQPS